MTICLNLIVKNESKVIKRCIDSVKDIIDYCVVADTGSTDDTKEIIREAMGDKCDIFDSPWNKPYFDFGYHREVALRRAYKSGCDYALIMDADMVMEYKEGAFDKLTADAYTIDIKHGDYAYALTLLLGLKKNWHWYMPRHNYIAGDGVVRHLPNATLISSPGGGAKSHGKTSEQKFLEDAEILEDYYKDNPDSARAVFYIARSYSDAGKPEKAKEWYLKRAEMGGWIAEVHWSLYGAAKCEQTITGTFPWEMFCRAHEANPTERDALYELVKCCHLAGWNHMGSLLGVTEHNPRNLFILNKHLYNWAFDDQSALCADKSGNHAKALMLWQRIIDAGKYPTREESRLKDNVCWAAKRLYEKEYANKQV